MTINELNNKIDYLTANKNGLFRSLETTRITVVEALTNLLELQPDTKIITSNIGERSSAFEIYVMNDKGKHEFGHGITIYFDTIDGARMGYGSMGSFYSHETTRIRHCQNLGLVATKLPEIDTLLRLHILEALPEFKEYRKIEEEIDLLFKERRILEVEGEQDVKN